MQLVCLINCQSEHRHFIITLLQSLAAVLRGYATMDYLSTALSLVVMLVALYYFTTRNHNLFKKHRIMHVPLTPLFGNMESFVGRQIMPDLLAKIYLDSKYIGFYEFLTPAIGCCAIWI